MKLEGIRVLDLSQYLPGPHLTMMMADHGADVIRIESPEGEPTRAIGKYHGDTTVWFRNTHRGKRSVVLDLKRPQAVDAFLALARTADVVIEAFRPGVVDRLGVGPAQVTAVNPRAIYCSISAFGQSGPDAHRVAHDLSIEAECGLVGLNLGSDGVPVMPCVPAADMAGSLMALSGILMALLRREKTGKGEVIDISMQDSLVSWMVNIVSPVFAERRELVPRDERSLGGNAFYGIYRCADDGYITLGAAEHKFVAALLGELGRPELAELCRLPPGPGQEPVRAFLRERFATEARAHWEALCARLNIGWAPVRGVKEALDSPHLRERRMIVEFDGGDTHLGIPIRFADEPGRIEPRAPALREHTEQVLRELGYEGDALDAVIARAEAPRSAAIPPRS